MKFPCLIFASLSLATPAVMAEPSATLGGTLSATPTNSEDFEGLPAQASYDSPFVSSGFEFRTTTNTAFFIFPGTGIVGFPTNSLYAGAISGMVRIRFADGSNLEEVQLALGNGTGSTDPNDYYWIRTYAKGVFTGKDFQFTAPRGSTFTVSGGGFDELRVNTYHTLAALQSRSETALGAPSIDNVKAIKSLNASVDVKPGSPRNTINVRSQGSIDVAILGSPTLSVSTIDWTSVRFGATGSEASIDGYALQDVNGDGLLDSLLRFRTAGTGLRCTSTTATLKGRLNVGTFFSGSDTVRVTGCN